MKARKNRRMLSWVAAGLLAVGGAGAAGCGREKAGAQDPGTLPRPPEGGGAVAPGADGGRGASELLGTVSGTPFSVKDAVFMWQDQADDLTLILSDRPGLCPLLASGAMPGDATVLILMLKHNTPENRDAPFAPGTYPLRVPGQEKAAQDLKHARVLKLDKACGNTLPDGTSTAAAGEVVLDTIAAQKNGTATGRVKLTFGAGKETLEGPFKAVFCELPRDAPAPRGCR